MALWLVTRISVVYAIPTIPTWDNDLVPPGFWALSCATAPLVTLATLALVRRRGVEVPAKPLYTWFLLGLSALALVVTVIILSLQNAGLAQISNAFGSAAQLVPWNAWAIGGLGLLGAAGIAVCSVPILRQKSLPLKAALTGTALMLLGAVFVRIAFYSLHMTL
jgi:anaerobic dimethyl sulfoxide reductase subunit C (anchor subunit)